MFDPDRLIWSRFSSRSSSTTRQLDASATDTSRTESAPGSTGDAATRNRGLDLKTLPLDVLTCLSYGAKFGDCRMSTIRKYFCLVVLLDLVMHSVVYTWYLQHADDYSLTSLVQCQMSCYNIRTSFVDILLLSIGRFVALETTYGALGSDSWVGTALTTALTSVFIIVKPFHYDWENECQRVWPVSLILMSLAWAWLEAFLVECRLIGMETLAQTYEDSRDLPKIGVFSAFVPITSDVFRSLVARPERVSHR